MNVAIFIIRISLIILAIAIALAATNVTDIYHLGMLISGLYLTWIIWTITVHLKKKKDHKEYLPKTLIFMGSWLLFASLITTIASFFGIQSEINLIKSITCSIGALLIMYIGRKQTLNKAQHDRLAGLDVNRHS